METKYFATPDPDVKDRIKDTIAEGDIINHPEN